MSEAGSEPDSVDKERARCSEIASSFEKKSVQVDYDERSKELQMGEQLRQEMERGHPKKMKKYIKMKIEQRYFTCADGVTEENQRDLLNEPSPFAVPKDMEEFAHKVMTKAWRTELRNSELLVKYNERHNYKTRQQQDMLQRLYVKEPPVKQMVTITDVDPEFFSLIQGRPIREKLDIREYIQTIRDVLRTKIVTGYRDDDTMLIDESVILEQKMIDEIKANYQEYVNTFEEFMYRDHQSSMNLLNESEKASLMAQEKYEDFKQLSKAYGALRSVLYSTEEKWRNCKMYQRFLYLVSPMSWRKEHDFHLVNHDDMRAMHEVSSIFNKYRLNVSHQHSLEHLVEQFMVDCSTQDEPKLYFTDPEQLLEAFRFMETQNLNSLLHAEELAGPLENVKTSMAQAKLKFDIEVAQLQESIDKLAGGILWEEERAQYLEELAMDLINGMFKDLTIDENILNMHVYVEDVYETRIGPNDANLTMGDMMKSIEVKFREELIKLDQMPSELVALLESNCYIEEAKLLKIAHEAARKLFEFERLFESLNKVFSPPYTRIQKELMWRSPPLNPPKPIPPPPRELSQKEKDYLDFFTMYCKHTDNPEEFGIILTKPPVRETDGFVWDLKGQVQRSEEEQANELSKSNKTSKATIDSKQQNKPKVSRK